MKALGQYLLVDNRRAIVMAFIAMFLPLFGSLIAAIIVAFVTLAKGWRAGLSILVWLALPMVSLLVLRRVGYFDMLFVNCVIVWLAALVLRTTQSWHVTIELSAVVGLLFVCVLHLYVSDVKHLWQLFFADYLQQYAAMTGDMSAKQMMQSFVIIAPYASGLIALQSMVSVWLPTYLGRSWWKSMITLGKLEIPGKLRLVVITAATALVLGAALISPATLMDCLPIIMILLASLLISLIKTWVLRQRHALG